MAIMAHNRRGASRPAAAMVYKSCTMNQQNATKNIAADVIDALGGVPKTAKLFETTRAAALFYVYQWRRRGQIPPVHLAAALLLMQAKNNSAPLARAVRAQLEKRPKPPAMAAMRASRKVE